MGISHAAAAWLPELPAAAETAADAADVAAAATLWRQELHESLQVAKSAFLIVAETSV